MLSYSRSGRFLNLQFSGALTMSKLLEEVRDLIRTRIIAIAPEGAYLNWIRQYVLFHGKRHPAEMGQTKSLNSSPISQ